MCSRLSAEPISLHFNVAAEDEPAKTLSQRAAFYSDPASAA
jgi:hypothetical protein